MPQIRLDVNDAGELAEMLESLSQWLASDPALEVSFGRWIGHPGYGITQLRQDLDRFTFLLGGARRRALARPARRPGQPRPVNPAARDHRTPGGGRLA